MAQKIIMVLGPTASGKTKFGVNLAANINGEIIGADSRQVYRGLDIGSGKDLAEYTLPDGRNVPYHLIDIREPGEEYSLADFLTDADRAINDIASRGKVPCIVGGTALYLHGLLSAYQLQGGAPDMTARNELRQLTNAQLRDTLRALDENNPILTKEPENRIRLIRAIELARGGDPDAAREPDLSTDREYLIFGVLRDRETVRRNIELRLRQRLEQENMLEEGRRLHAQGMTYERMEFLGLEYRAMALFLQGKTTEEEMFETLLAKIRQFAKRQDSWFRKLERDGFPIHWMAPEKVEDAVGLANRFLAGEDPGEPVFRLSNVNYGAQNT